MKTTRKPYRKHSRKHSRNHSRKHKLIGGSSKAKGKRASGSNADNVSVSEEGSQNKSEEEDAQNNSSEEDSHNSNLNTEEMIKPISSSGKKLVKELHRNIFDMIRNKLKEMRDENAKDAMFLFNEPSALVNDFIYCLYNENETWNKRTKTDNLFMMTSILELDKDDEIFITISEEPDSQDNFIEKINKLITLIRWIVYDYKDIINAKNKLGNKIVLLDCPSYIKTQLNIMPKNIYRQSNERHIPDSIKAIKKINIIYNQTYIKNRRKGFSYEPFYKTDVKKAIKIIACNSGSICSESKIFSYIHENSNIDKIKGMIAYWVGNRPLSYKKCKNATECHYHPKYCYNHNNKEDNDKLRYIIEYMKNKDLISPDILRFNLSDIFRGYALPCPGCVLNYERFMKDIKNNWDISQCIERNRDDLPKRKAARQEIMNQIATHI